MTLEEFEKEIEPLELPEIDAIKADDILYQNGIDAMAYRSQIIRNFLAKDKQE